MILATAETGPGINQMNVLTIAYFGIVGLVMLLALVPIALIRRHNRARTHAVLTLAIFWGLLSAGSLFTTALTEFRWVQERDARLSSGYDSNPDQNAPAEPWPLWIGLGAGYIILLMWSIQPKPPQH